MRITDKLIDYRKKTLNPICYITFNYLKVVLTVDILKNFLSEKIDN